MAERDSDLIGYGLRAVTPSVRHPVRGREVSPEEEIPPAEVEQDPERRGTYDTVQHILKHGAVATWRKKFLERYAAEKERLGGRTDFEVLTGKDYGELAEEYPKSVATLGKMRRGFTGHVVRRAAGVDIGGDTSRRIQQIEHETAESLPLGEKILTSAGAMGYELPAFGGGIGVARQLALRAGKPLLARASPFLVGAGIGGGGAAMEGAPPADIALSAGLTGTLPYSGRIVGAGLSRAARPFSRRLAEGITRFGETRPGAGLYAGTGAGAGVGAVTRDPEATAEAFTLFGLLGMAHPRMGKREVLEPDAVLPPEKAIRYDPGGRRLPPGYFAEMKLLGPSPEAPIEGPSAGPGRPIPGPGTRPLSHFGTRLGPETPTPPRLSRFALREAPPAKEEAGFVVKRGSEFVMTRGQEPPTRPPGRVERDYRERPEEFLEEAGIIPEGRAEPEGPPADWVEGFEAQDKAIRQRDKWSRGQPREDEIEGFGREYQPPPPKPPKGQGPGGAPPFAEGETVVDTGVGETLTVQSLRGKTAILTDRQGVKRVRPLWRLKKAPTPEEEIARMNEVANRLKGEPAPEEPAPAPEEAPRGPTAKQIADAERARRAAVEKERGPNIPEREPLITNPQTPEEWEIHWRQRIEAQATDIGRKNVERAYRNWATGRVPKHGEAGAAEHLERLRRATTPEGEEPPPSPPPAAPPPAAPPAAPAPRQYFGRGTRGKAKAFEKAGGLQVSAAQRVQFWKAKKPAEGEAPTAAGRILIPPSQLDQKHVSYRIKGTTGLVNLEVRETRTGKEIRIQDIFISPDERAQIGPAGLRQMLRELRSDYPDAKVLYGDRLTGIAAKHGRRQAKVSIPEKTVEEGPSRLRTPEEIARMTPEQREAAAQAEREGDHERIIEKWVSDKPGKPEAEKPPEPAHPKEDTPEAFWGRVEKSEADKVSRENAEIVEPAKKEHSEKGELRIGGPKAEKPGGPKFKPEVTEVLTAGEQRTLARLGERIKTGLRDAFVPSYRMKGIPELADGIEYLRQAKGAPSMAHREAVADLHGIVGDLDLARTGKTETIYHGWYVYLKNLEWRKVNTNDPRMPKDLTLQDLQEAITELEPFIRDNPKIMGESGSVVRHKRMVEAHFNDLVRRGEIAPDAARNPYYVKHYILDYQPTKRSVTKITTLLRGPRRTETMRYRGSPRLPDSDYMNVMYRYFRDVRRNNLHSDWSVKLLARYNQPEMYGRPARVPQMEIVEVDRSQLLYKPFVTDLPRALRDAIQNGLLYDPETARRWGQPRSMRERPPTPEEVKRWGKKRSEKIKQMPSWIEQVEKIMAGEKRNQNKVYIPRALAETLMDPRALGLSQPPEIVQLVQQGIRVVKSAMLHANPARYGITNFTGDFQVQIVQDPAVVLRIPRATAIIIDARRGTIHPDLVPAIEKCVLDSGRTAQETFNVRNLTEFSQQAAIDLYKDIQTGVWRHPGKTMTEAFKRKLIRFWNGMQEIQEDRENILRLANWLTQLDRVRAGKEPLNVRSNQAELNAISDPFDRAAKVAREALIDYGNTTYFVDQYLRNMLLPFYMFTRHNVPFWAKIPFKANSWVRELPPAPERKFLPGVTIPRAKRYAASKAALWAASASAIASLWAWNRIVMGHVEEKLSPDRRTRFHFNLGLDDNDEPLTYSVTSAFDEALRAYGLDGVSPDIGDWLRGEKRLVDVAEKWERNSRLWGVVPGAGYAYDTLMNLAGPPMQVLYSTMGVKTYPEPREYRILPETQHWKILAMGLGAGEAIRAAETAMGHRGTQDFSDYLREYVTMVRRPDAERENYYAVRNLVRDYMEKIDMPLPSIHQRERVTSGAFRDLDRAIAAGDEEKAVGAFAELKKIAETRPDIKMEKSLIQRMSTKNPLQGLGERKRTFYEGLSTREKKMVKRAIVYYREMLASVGRASKKAQAVGITKGGQ